jgi:peptidoglycan/LPS O-acetylase OafA/YrhL
MYVPSIGNLTLIPQAWSLSTEFGFYALFPLIWRSRTACWALAICGCCVLGLATFNILPSDYYAYRLLPGTLPFFLLGRALFCRDNALLAFLASFLMADFTAVWATGGLDTGYNREILLAVLAGPPALALAARLRPWRFDSVAGHASYGAYLAHIAVILVCLDGVTSALVRGIAAAILSGAAGLLAYLAVEKPFNRYRRRLRRVGWEGRLRTLPLEEGGDRSADPIPLAGI